MTRHDRGDGADVRGRAEHAELERRNADFGEDLRRLALDQRRVERFDRIDAPRVLHRERGDDRERMAAERGEREHVGLQAGAAGGIGGCEGQD